MKHEVRAVEFDSADRRFRLHGELVSEVASPAESGCVFTGHGNYELSSNSTRRWMRTFDFAFADARVLADGSVAGLAYGESLARDQECAHFVVLAPDGAPRVDQRVPIEGLGRDSLGCIEPPLGWFVDEAHGRFAVWHWFAPEQREAWSSWSLATGKADGWRLEIADEARAFACSGAAEVRGTGLVLVHAWVRGERPTLYRSEYHLVDGDGRSVWRFAVDEDRVEGATGRAVPGANGLVGVESGEKPAFRVRCFTAKKVVRFELAQDAGTKAWTARETGRE